MTQWERRKSRSQSSYYSDDSPPRPAEKAPSQQSPFAVVERPPAPSSAYDPYLQRSGSLPSGAPPPPSDAYDPYSRQFREYPPTSSSSCGPPSGDPYGRYPHQGYPPPLGAPPFAGPPPPGYPPPSAFPAQVGYGNFGYGYDYPPPNGYPQNPPPPAGYGAPPPLGYGSPYGAPPPPGYGSHFGAPLAYGGYALPPPPSGGGGAGGGDRERDRQGSKKNGGSGGGGGGGGGARGRGNKRKRTDSPAPDPVASRDDPGAGCDVDSSFVSTLVWGDVEHRISDAAIEQDGSRFLQMTLASGNADLKRKIYEACLPDSVKLAKDAFGNFVVQKMLDHCSLEQQECIVGRMKGEVFTLACNKYACRVMQKALQVLTSEQQMVIIEELQSQIIPCIENMHGNHVVQKCVENVPLEQLSFVLEPVNEHIEYVCTHMYGCRIVQRLLERLPPPHLETLLSQLIPKAIGNLARDKHGNYVLQCMLERCSIHDRRAIIDTIAKNLVEYCKNKISSNVVEKCFKVATNQETAQDFIDQRRNLIQTLIGQPGKSPLTQIIHDKFGNYIVQNVINNSRGLEQEDRELLQRVLEDLAPQLYDSATGKHIISAFQKEFGRKL